MSRSGLAVASLAAGCGWALWDGLGGPGWMLATPLAVLLPAAAAYAVGWFSPVPTAAVAAGTGAVLMTTANQLVGEEYHWLDDLVFFAVVVGGPAAAGVAARERARRVRRLDRLTADLAEQRRVEVATARLEEQTRIQQAVHTRLAERIGAIAVRAEGAGRSTDRQAFAQIETESRGVLDELRAALGWLASVDEPADPAPVVEAPAAPEPAPGVSAADAGLALLLGGCLAVETLVVDHAQGPDWANIVAAMATAAPLVMRRRAPLLAIALSLLAGNLMTAWLTPIPETVSGVGLMVVIFYTVGAWCRSWWWLPGWALALAGTAAMELLSASSGTGEGDDGWIVLVWTVAAVGLGRIAAGWQLRVRRTRAALAELEAGAGVEIRLAAARQRQALAGELHDTVAHAMTVVCLQAGAPHPDARSAAEALQTIAATAAASLGELREGLEAIEARHGPLDPVHLSAIGRRVGVVVETLIDAAALPGPTDASTALAYRLIREALVNAGRHAPGAAARVRVERCDSGLEVEVVDEGGGCARFAAGTGSGLTGLHAAVTGVGGRLEWGPHRDGFRVVASIPTGAS